MNRKYKLLLLIAFFITSLGAFAQDIIIQKNGTKIRCRIVDENPTTLYYSLGEQKTLYDIKKSDVEEYFIANKSPNTNAPDGYSNTSGRPAAKPSPLGTQGSKKNEILILSLSAGLSFPMGQFSGKDTDSSYNLARGGGVLQASLIIKATKYFGVKIAYRHQTNSFDANTFNSEIAPYLSQGRSCSTAAGNWVVTGPFGGVFFSIPTYKKPELSFNLDFSLGYVNCKSPDITTTVKYGSATLGTIVQPVASSHSLAFLGGIGLQYRFSDYVAFHTNFNLCSTGASFSGVPIISTSSQGSSTQTVKFNQNLVTLNLLVGFSFMVF